MSLWITYAWKDNNEGNFDYLVQELNQYGINTEYDKVALIPGQKLWTQIAEKINDHSIKAWAYLITPNSLKSNPCIEELEYAINRCINQDSTFPLIGLVTKDVPFDSVPTALKVRLCVSLNDPNWKEQLKAGLEKRPVSVEPTNHLNKFIINYTSDTTTMGITSWLEVRPRFEEVYNWRVGILDTLNVINFGVGPAGSKSIFPSMEMVFDGQATADNINFKLMGSKVISHSTSAFIHHYGKPSPFIFIGNCADPFGPILNSFIVKTDS